MEADYVVTAQQHVNRYNPDTGEAERGWWVTYRDELTKVQSQVFVRDQDYPLGVAPAITAELGAIRHVHNLTGT